MKRPPKSTGLLSDIYNKGPKQVVEDKVHDLLRAYHDLEATLKSLKKAAKANTASAQVANINVKKLINQLSVSKKRLERKIGNTLLLESQSIKSKIKNLRDSLHN